MIERDELLGRFRHTITGTRWGTAGIALVLAATGASPGPVPLWCVAIVAIALYRTWRPVSVVPDRNQVLAVVGELVVTLLAVLSTGGWDSPFVFCLITPIIVAGFARGFILSLSMAAATSIIVSVADLTTGGDWRVAGQWSSELVLIAVVAGYARHLASLSAQQHTEAIDRLSDANELLFSLHRVAQDLPASLDLDETLDSTVNRLRELFEFTAAAILLHEPDGSWRVVRRDGCRLPPRIEEPDLPAPLRSAIADRGCVRELNLLSGGGPGLVPQMYSGLYAPLQARGAVIGLISLEHADEGHFRERDVELLEGFVEPAALAIDNAMWFARLRTVGAEEERTRIARDLHDRIGQSLAYLAFELDRIVKSDGKGDEIAPSLERLRADLRDVIRDVRDTLYDLRTDVTDTDDIVSVLGLYTERVRERSGLEITIHSHVTARLPLLQEREVFRIAQEALANIEKHAQAHRVTISWRCSGTTAILDVADDGVGFPRGTAGRLDSYGIIGMRERADSIGATLEIDSHPGTGTRVRCALGRTPAPALGVARALV